MDHRPLRSRHGLTRCRACRAHIQTAARPSDTICPFCGENQLGIPKRQARSTIVAVGRGGLLAAGLMAFSAIGCAEEPAPPAPTPIVEAPDPLAPLAPMEPLAPPEPLVEAPPPVTPEPLLDEEPSEPIAERPRPRPRPRPDPIAPPDRPIAVPAYGVAPPDEWRPDPSPDMRPTPRYGLPPMRAPRTDGSSE